MEEQTVLFQAAVWPTVSSSADQLALDFGTKYQEPQIGFRRDAFEKPANPSEERQRNIYLANLTTALYTFYGGDVGKIAALETPEDSYINRNGNPLKKREQYPEQPGVCVETCRTLAEMIFDANEYEEAVDILRWHDKEVVEREMKRFLAPYVQQTDNLELRRIHGSELERRVA